MTEPPAKRPLEGVLRMDETAEDLVLLLRGGAASDDAPLLMRQAARLDLRFTFKAGRCFGISVFAATEASEAWVLAKNMDVRRRYCRVRRRDITDLQLLPTFSSPHWTVMFGGPDGPEYDYFVDALGS
jgi:hypothetical protein